MLIADKTCDLKAFPLVWTGQRLQRARITAGTGSMVRAFRGWPGIGKMETYTAYRNAGWKGAVI